eukprot:m.212034 g.212034  ORF g.212034 m.212034 type:complete len:162 (-) comp18583_c0_seq4:4769-5254(-)
MAAAGGSGADIRMAGLLMKQGYIRRTWKLRWFELSTDGTIRYFKSDTGTATLKGSFHLSDCSAVFGTDELAAQWPESYPPAMNRACRFGLQVGARTWMLVAPKPAECDAWMSAIRKQSPNLQFYKGRSVLPSRPFSAPEKQRVPDKYDSIKQMLQAEPAET